MKIIAVPIQIGSVKVHIAKGRRWSVVEHALLEAVCRNPQTAQSLSDEASLPLRMVVEALINLMRVGWVELRTEGKQGKFFATDGGKVNVGRDDLPAVTRMFKKSVRFVVEQVTGSVLRYRGLDYEWASKFKDVHCDAIVASNPKLPPPNQVRIINSLLLDDEEYHGLASGAARPGNAYALAQVTGDQVRGLPGAPAALLREIAKVASSARTSPKPVSLPEVRAVPPEFEAVPLSFNADQNLVLGGTAHKQIFIDVVKRASARIIVHSTFVGGGASGELISLLMAAAKRGVRVDILWGKADSSSGENSTRDACTEINLKMKAERIDQFIKAHPFSTGSHSKMLVADDGRDEWTTVIGSCNWLSTDFSSFETSVLIRDQKFAAGALGVLAQMAMAVTGWNGGISAALAGQAVNIERFRRASGVRRAKGKIVLAREHADYIRAARDEATSSIIIGSHRLGRSAPNLSIAPTRAAVLDRGVNAVLYYGKLSDGMTQDAATELRLASSANGLKVRQIHDPRMHGKFLCWDDSNILITSHNLLSANPAGDFEEIGVHIHSPLVGRYLREKLELTFNKT